MILSLEKSGNVSISAAITDFIANSNLFAEYTYARKYNAPYVTRVHFQACKLALSINNNNNNVIANVLVFCV